MAKAKPTGSSPLALLDASERSIFQASSGRALASATQAQLGKLIGQARVLRDKWRDQFQKQRRTSQQTAAARGVVGNERSRAKSDLFGDVLGRLEARLAELGGTVAQAVSAATRRTEPSKAARTRGHRATRAATRAVLAKHVTAKPGKKRGSEAGSAQAKAAPSVEARKKANAKAPSAATVAGSAAAAGAVKPSAKTASAPQSKKRHVGRPASVATAKATGKSKKRVITVEPVTQLRAATKLKASRVRMAGLDTRLRGHTKAAGRRQQGRRDGRSR